jgi:hypothetical protein
MIETGFVQFDRTDEVAAWAATARAAAGDVLTNPQPEMQRLGGTWYVGVDALPNDERGTLNGTPLRGPWDGMIPGLHCTLRNYLWSIAGFPVVMLGNPMPPMPIASNGTGRMWMACWAIPRPAS